jgi:ABC-type sugar transport system ATPase subunit
MASQGGQVVHGTVTTEERDDGPAGATVLRIEGLSKTFPGTRALVDVDLDIRPGEIHALVGHNGSGKSTLIKCLSGYHHSDPGARAWWHDDPVDFAELGRSHHARGGRLSFVHQNLGLVNELDMIDNFALHGDYTRTRFGLVDWHSEERLARQLIAPFNVDIDVRRPLAEATPVERTIVAIAAALQGWDPRGGVLVLDEPTAVLPPSEVGHLFGIVRDLRAQGAAVLYVSHRLEEIFELADRVTVLRAGVKIETRAVAGLTEQQLVELMLGAGVEADYRAPLPEPRHDVVLEVAGLTGRYLRGASFSLAKGEVLGIAGLPDAGRDELPRILSDGVAYPVSGRVRLPAVSQAWIDVDGWRSRPVALIPPDRGREGVIDQMTVAENLTLAVLGDLGPAWRLSKKREAAFVTAWMRRLDVKAAGPAQPLGTLSGGNQQKVLIGRSLARDPQVLVMCEPTAGVDIGARHAIYDLVAAQAATGVSVLVASSDIEDLIGLCSRVLVLRDGLVAEQLTGQDINHYRLVHAMEGFSS